MRLSLQAGDGLRFPLRPRSGLAFVTAPRR